MVQAPEADDMDAVPQALDRLVLRGAPDAPAIEDKAGSISFAELDAGVGRLAAWLRGQGLEAGDRVASWLAKTRLACMLPLAAARAGLVHVPVNPLLKHKQVAHIMCDSGARLLITGPARAATFAPDDLPDTLRLIDDASAAAAIRDEAVAPLAPSHHDPDLLVAILYTSGSTGRPKGVMLSHANLWLGAISVARYLQLDASDRTLCVLPLSFDYGQNQLLSTWAAGGCAVPLDYLTPRDVIRGVERFEITTLAGVPPLWVQLAEATWSEAALARLRRLTNSGGRLSVPLVRKLRAMFAEAEIFSMYGLTEAFRSTYLPPALIDAHPESIGRAIPFAEVLVITPDGAVAADNVSGELVHCGPLVARGYWQDAERTALRFRPAPAASLHGGIAVWSGDTVVRDSEGLLRFVGRDDEMIKSAGNRISPTEIEEAAVASGAAAEAVALGVADERLGEAIMIVARPASDDADDRLARWFKRELPNFMHPRDVIWRRDLPRNANGKLDRAVIAAEVRGTRGTRS